MCLPRGDRRFDYNFHTPTSGKFLGSHLFHISRIIGLNKREIAVQFVARPGIFLLSTPQRPDLRITHPPVQSVLVAPRTAVGRTPGHALLFIWFTSLPFLTEAVNNSNSIAPNGNMISQSLIRQHARGSCCGLILCLFRHLLGLWQESHKCRGQDSIWAHPSTGQKRCSFVTEQNEF